MTVLNYRQGIMRNGVLSYDGNVLTLAPSGSPMKFSLANFDEDLLMEVSDSVSIDVQGLVNGEVYLSFELPSLSPNLIVQSTVDKISDFEPSSGDAYYNSRLTAYFVKSGPNYRPTLRVHVGRVSDGVPVTFAPGATFDTLRQQLTSEPMPPVTDYKGDFYIVNKYGWHAPTNNPNRLTSTPILPPASAIYGTAGEALSKGDVAFFAPDGTIMRHTASMSITPVGVVTEATPLGSAVTLQTKGVLNLDTSVGNVSAGDYVFSGTSGTLVTTAPLNLYVHPIGQVLNDIGSKIILTI